MIIQVERTGGFAGLTMQAIIDTEHLDPEEREELEELVEKSEFFRLPPRLKVQTMAVNQFEYVITIEDEFQRHTLEAHEEALDPRLNELVQRVLRLARRKQREKKDD
ncbi:MULTISPECIES: protealysin inhibitor emfourin [Anaerolinea]|uniref:Uncharacterized protein n=1 Tax=Anaerolinea thermophila (strain DSM 14523 / JCM 11388 / NBRC 100420 / UNI-1) TaxID=926569 RepID=E8N0T7_ANATU|nr:MULTISPECIES: protealysin inhibitor emfourin [Anaerolinea]BAJ62482.1 hypothetical protein ANT_04480 [Anaerolinea thermophila UNI-1]